MDKTTRIALLFGCLLGAAIAWAQEETMANQGTPGTRGSWPVVMGGSITIWDGGTANTFVPYPCANASPHKVTSVVNASTTTPATAQTGRVWVNVCNSPQNAAGSIVKCRSDGTAPVFALGNPGDVMELGDCQVYYTTANILCISNAAGGVSTTTYECF